MVSILVPAYNSAKWIRQSIQSALMQTWPNKEIIIIDDGSTDRTLEIARGFESTSVKVISQQNRGASNARNRALALARGDFIQWLDADDLLAPDKISEQMKHAHHAKANRTLFSSSFGLFYHRTNKARFFPSALWQDHNKIDWLLRSFGDNLWMHPAGWLVSRRLTESAGPWDERLSMDDDGEYFSRVMAQSDGIRFVNEAKTYYRQSSFKQLSKNLTERAIDSLVLSTKLKIRLFLSLEESERTKKACLALLQTNRDLFYPEKPDLLQEMAKMAFELGGKLEPPELGRRSKILQGLVGPRIAKEAKTILRKLRLARAVKWDELMQKLGR